MPHHHHKHPYQTTPEANNATTTATADQSREGRSALAESIRLRAYSRWESAGMPPGDGVQFWLEAERELATMAAK